MTALSVHVALDGGRDYDILIGRGLVAQAGERLAALGAKAAGIVTDSNVGALYAADLKASLEAAGLRAGIVTVPPGEASKSYARFAEVCDGLLALKPYFKKDGLVTAGNASGIVDGAAATVLAGEEFARAQGAKPLGRLIAWAVVGVEPGIMGIGPAPAARKALAKAGMTLAQMDLVEINEAFAPQYLAVEKELGLDRTKTNVHGGAIAIGHPLAATGTRITIHLLHALRQRKQRFGLGEHCAVLVTGDRLGVGLAGLVAAPDHHAEREDEASDHRQAEEQEEDLAVVEREIDLVLGGGQL